MEEQCGSRRTALWSTLSIPRIQSNGGHASHTPLPNKSGDLKGRASLRLALLLPLRCSTFSHALKPSLKTTEWFQRDLVGRAFFFLHLKDNTIKPCERSRRIWFVLAFIVAIREETRARLLLRACNYCFCLFLKTQGQIICHRPGNPQTTDKRSLKAGKSSEESLIAVLKKAFNGVAFERQH